MDFCGESDIFKRRILRKQIEGLEHESYLELILALLLSGELIGITAVKNNAAVNGYRAAVRSFEHIDAAQQSCFSAARRADYSEDILLFKREAYAFENLGIAEGFFEIFNFKYSHDQPL